MNDADRFRHIANAVLHDRGPRESAVLALALAHALTRSLDGSDAEAVRADQLAQEIAHTALATGPFDDDAPLERLLAQARQLDERGVVVDLQSARRARGLPAALDAEQREHAALPPGEL